MNEPYRTQFITANASVNALTTILAIFARAQLVAILLA